MRFERDFFGCGGAFAPGVLYGGGGRRGIPDAVHAGAAHPADALRYGGGHHAGGKCVELAAACHRAGGTGVAAGALPPAAGLVIGAVGLLRLEQAAGRLLCSGAGHCGRMVLAVTLHNLPEGMVVGLAAALALSGEPDAASGALALALGIGLQNLPEGAAVSLPILQKGESKKRAFFAGAASGLVEPVGALLALALAGWVSAALPWLMSAAAGCMVCVTAQEMIPEAVENDEPAGVISVVLGFALMMALDVAL